VQPAADITSYTGWSRHLAHFLCVITSPNIGQFSDFYHCQNQEKNCNNVIAKDPITPRTSCYTTLWNANVMKQKLKTRLL